jgi:hypothetical protein
MKGDALHRTGMIPLMPPARRLLAVAVVAIALAACGRGRPKGLDEMNLIVEEVGNVPIADVLEPPAEIGEITTWRTTFPGQLFAAVKTEAPCPRDIHTIAGAQVKKDRIELCYTATARDEPVPGFACSPVVYVKYEIMRVPADVEPKFVFVGACS